MEINQLKYFHCAAKTEHITKAAEELHVAQPALTKSIKLLEGELGVPLFDRKGRNVYLTEYGKYLAGRLDVLLPQFNGLVGEVTAMAERIGNTVTVNVLAASTLVTNAVILYKKKNPKAIFRLVQNEEDERCDITVTTAKLNERVIEFDKQKIFKERIFLAVPKKSVYAVRGEVELTELAGEEFINLAGSRHFRAVCDRLCVHSGFIPNTVFESDSPVAVQNLIAAGVGIGFWPEYSWGGIPKREVELVKIKKPECAREIIVGYNQKENGQTVAEDFFNFFLYFIERRMVGSK